MKKYHAVIKKVGGVYFVFLLHDRTRQWHYVDFLDAVQFLQEQGYSMVALYENEYWFVKDNTEEIKDDFINKSAEILRELFIARYGGEIK